MKNGTQKNSLNHNGPHLSATEVMARFDISRSTLYRWIKDLAFPEPRRIRGKRYFRLTDINAWDEAQSGKPVHDPETALGLPIVSDVIRDYEEFVAAMRARREALGMSVMETDARSGLQEGYTTKLENAGAKWGKGMGPGTMPLWLGGLRVGLVLVDLPRRPAKRDRPKLEMWRG